MNVGRPFPTASDLLSQHQGRNISKKLRECKQCGKTFVKNLCLSEHLISVNGKKPFKSDHYGYCRGKFYESQECGKNYVITQDLFFIREFIPVRNYVNEYCGFNAFRYSFQLSPYQRIYADQKPQELKHCEKIFPFVVGSENKWKKGKKEQTFHK